MTLCHHCHQRTSILPDRWHHLNTATNRYRHSLSGLTDNITVTLSLADVTATMTNSLHHVDTITADTVMLTLWQRGLMAPWWGVMRLWVCRWSGRQTAVCPLSPSPAAVASCSSPPRLSSSLVDSTTRLWPGTGRCDPCTDLSHKQMDGTFVNKLITMHRMKQRELPT